MRQKIITANWKLNMLRPETRSFAERFLALLGDGDFDLRVEDGARRSACSRPREQPASSSL